MLNGYETCLLFSALFALGCGGNAVDVGHTRSPGWIDAPDGDAPAGDMSAGAARLIYENEHKIYGFALDETTLYALVDHTTTFELVSCPLEHCRSQRKILLRSPKLGDEADLTPIVLTGGWLYWTVANVGPTGVAGCPVTGCSEAQFMPTTFRSLLVGDTDGAYWIDQDRSLMRITPSARAPERLLGLTEDVVEARHLLARGDYMYFILGDAVSTIQRVRKDGTGDVELLATDEAISGLTVSSDAIYYPSQILTGRIAQCPLDDCQAGGSTLAANQRWPKETQIDGNEAFWLSSSTFSERGAHAALASCKLPDCASVKQRVSDVPVDENLLGQNSRGPTFAVNQQSIVWFSRYATAGTSFWRLAR